MSDVLIRSQNESLVYDPQISGYDTNFWKTVTGSAPTISSNLLRINAAEIATYSAWKDLDVEFKITVPVAPTAADVRSWGLKSPSLGNSARVEFDITDDVFAAKFYDSDGNALVNQPLTWSAGYTATATKFRITIFNSVVRWLINGTCVARYKLSDSATYKRIKDGVPVHIRNSNADNMDITYIALRNVGSLT